MCIRDRVYPDRLLAIPQSASLTAPFTQGSLGRRLFLGRGRGRGPIVRRCLVEKRVFPFFYKAMGCGSCKFSAARATEAPAGECKDISRPPAGNPSASFADSSLCTREPWASRFLKAGAAGRPILRRFLKSPVPCQEPPGPGWGQGAFPAPWRSAHN